jgi:ribosomal protein S27AE
MTDEKECPECGGKMILNEEHNETVCVDCGLVEESNSQSNETGDDVEPLNKTWDDVEPVNYTSNNTEELEESHSDDDDLVHSIHKEEVHHYWTELDDGELIVDDEPMNEREAGYHHNEYDYGEYFSCNCGKRFWEKESASKHLINMKS